MAQAEPAQEKRTAPRIKAWATRDFVFIRRSSKIPRFF
jgi:hypothetical protein